MHVIFVSIKEASKEASAGTTRAGHVAGVFRSWLGTWLATTFFHTSRARSVIVDFIHTWIHFDPFRSIQIHSAPGRGERRFSQRGVGRCRGT